VGFNASGGRSEPKPAQIIVDQFSGLVTNMAPNDVPSGASPDCSDNGFSPGSVFSRPCFQKVFANPLYPASQRTYGKTFTDNQGVVRNLYFYANGAITVEVVYSPPGSAVIANPGVETLLSQTSAINCMAKSVTLGGREYIAISDGQHGQEVPLQLTYDASGNAQLDRVTQDGPGASPNVASLPLPPVPMASIGGPGTLEIISITPTGLEPGGGYYTGLQISVAAGALAFPANSEVTIAGSTPGFYNQVWTITAAPLNDQTIELIGYTPAATGPGSGGTIALTAGSGVSIQRSGNVGTVNLAQNPNLKVGYLAQITGMTALQVGNGISSIVIDNEDFPGLATVTTNSPHGLQPQNQVTITGVDGVAIGGAVSASRQGGIVQFTTTTPHGLVPGAGFSASGFGDASFNFSSSVLQIVDPLNFTCLQDDVTNATSSGGALNLNWPVPDTTTPNYFEVQTAPTPTSFTVQLSYCDGTWNTGTVAFPWDGQFYVLSILPQLLKQINALSANIDDATLNIPVVDGTLFSNGQTIQIDSEQMVIASGGGSSTLVVSGRGANGTAAAAHAANAPVSVVTFSFTFTQYGPNGFTNQIGTVTPYGQIAPGLHQMCVLFQDRQGGITGPSPPVKIEAAGGQYLSVPNIPTGNSTCVARILAFTGAGGSEFFYIPEPGQVNGQIVSTSTVIYDNTTTNAFLDFGDPTLLEAIGISIPGNNLANQIVLDSALFFGSFEERLITFGQRNRVQSGEGTGGFLNLGFDGGQLPNAPGVPTGWNAAQSADAQLVASETLTPPRPAGFAWQIDALPSVAAAVPYGLLSQGAYQDVYGDPIISGNTLYRLRVWLQPSLADPGLIFFAQLSSASTGFTTGAAIPGSSMSAAGSFVEAVFSNYTPQTIPADLILSIWAGSKNVARTLAVDEFSLIYEEEPYLNDTGYGSYVENPQGMDGVSGLFGTDDNLPVFGMFILRQGLRLLSKDPGGKLYAVSGTNNTEPSGWEVDEEAAMCGLVGINALTVSQAADDSASGGPEWAAWISNAAVLIFGGQEPMPISAEIQSDPNVNPYGVPDFTSLNTAAQLTCWAANDYRAFRKTIYFGIPIFGAVAPNLILPVNYIGLSSAEQIADSPPVHLSLSGKMIARDLSRKWTRWRIPMNYGALMFRAVADLEPCFMGGATAAGAVFGNAYTLNSALKTDDDYGVVSPYYTTTAIPTGDQAEQFQTGSLMMILAYLLSTIQWTGLLQIQIFVNYLNNPWPEPLLLAALPTFTNDLEWGAKQATGRRFFLRYSSQPLPGTTDNGFNLTKVVGIAKQNARMPITGAFK
jgi:hypothetical protein